MLVLYQVYWRIIRFIGSTFAFVEVHIEINPYISRLHDTPKYRFFTSPVFPRIFDITNRGLKKDEIIFT